MLTLSLKFRENPEKSNPHPKKKCACSLSSTNRGSLLFREVARLTEPPVELTVQSILQYEKNPFIIMEPTIKPQNIGMTEVKLNVHFSLQLVMQSVLFYLLFEYHLQRHHKLALQKNPLVPTKINRIFEVP